MIDLFLPSTRADRKCGRGWTGTYGSEEGCKRAKGGKSRSKKGTKAKPKRYKSAMKSGTNRKGPETGEPRKKGGGGKSRMVGRVNNFWSKEGDTSAQLFPEASKSGRGTVKVGTRTRGSVRTGKDAEGAYSKAFKALAKDLPDGQKVEVFADNPAAIAVLDKSGLKRAAGRAGNTYRGTVSGGGFLRPGQQKGQMAISRRMIEGTSSRQALGNYYRQMTGKPEPRTFTKLPLETRKRILAQASKRNTTQGVNSAVSRLTTAAVQKLNSRPYSISKR